ncbi:MAG: aminotransferase class I/II-fold pyridoxal phosphate-dependent enzyme [Propionibacteriaceae bacterium]|jgi:cystathionine beta-lyase|nr:aminotransferase class I/II-fold pyridoxal phosphate-dependent enzyme [Propionibacteriaceae bacterium]
MAIFDLTEAELRKRSSMKWQTYPPDVLPLWVAEMDVAVHPAISAALLAAVENGDTGYPVGRRYAEAFRGFAKRRWGWEVADTQVRQSGDVMNSMLGTLQTVTEPGDGVVINPPIYPPFRTIVERYQRQLVEVALTDTGRLDLPGIEAALAGPAKPKAYLLCSPHNPNGTVHTAAELSTLLQLCAEHDVTLIVDEIHAPIVAAGTVFTPILSLPGSERAISVTSAGKAWNLACFKGGLIVGGTQTGDILARLPALLLQSMGHIAAITHAAAMNSAADWVDEYLLEVQANKELLASLLREQVPAARYTPSTGCYFGWVDCSGLGLANPARHFLDQGRVAFNDGATFGAQYGQWVRINLATSPRIITEAVSRMAAALSE